jgi:hypothetical protein
LLKFSLACALAMTTAVTPAALPQRPRVRDQAPHRCAGSALEQARKLLAFHVGPDDRLAIAEGVTRLPSVRNPANSAQRFDVLEVWGHVYKGKYRMRLIYAQMEGECVLMGQEILEHASL